MKEDGSIEKKPNLMDLKRQSKAKSDEEEGAKAKKIIRALKDKARYLEKKIAIANTINPKTKGTKKSGERSK